MHRTYGKGKEEKYLTGINANCAFFKLPVEILLKIFRYIGTPDLVNNVRLTCKYVDQILDEVFFRRRLRSYYRDSRIPPVTSLLGLNYDGSWKPGSKVSWKGMCYNLEVKVDVWKSISALESPLTEFHSVSNHTACVDTVKIFNKGRLAVSGARDRSLMLWNIEDVPYCIYEEVDSHRGWIWDIESSYDDSLFSCDWSGDAILWSLTNGLNSAMRFSLRTPILCVAGVPEYYVVGLQRREICFLDPRVNLNSQLSIRVHAAAVFDVTIDRPYILTVSEDRTLSVTDMRNLQICKSVVVSDDSSYPKTMSRVDNLLYVSTASGIVKVIDLNADFQICMTLQTLHPRVTSISATPGILYTASRDNYMTVYTIEDPLIRLVDIFIDDAEITRVDYSRCKIAFARSDHRVSFLNMKPFF